MHTNVNSKLKKITKVEIIFKIEIKFLVNNQ